MNDFLYYVFVLVDSLVGHDIEPHLGLSVIR